MIAPGRDFVLSRPNGRDRRRAARGPFEANKIRRYKLGRKKVAACAPEAHCAFSDLDPGRERVVLSHGSEDTAFRPTRTSPERAPLPVCPSPPGRAAPGHPRRAGATNQGAGRMRIVSRETDLGRSARGFDV